MNKAVFALLFSSVFAQMKPGDEKWNRTMDMQREMMWKMYDKDPKSMVVDARPKNCSRSHQCGPMYRMGGCCGRVEITQGFDDLNDMDKKMFEQQGEGGLCMMGSAVDAFRDLEKDESGGVSMMDYSRHVYDNDPMIKATWGMVYEAKDFDDFHNWLMENKPEHSIKGNARISGKCMDEQLHPLDMMQMCSSSADCADTWGHFNGGCCGRSELIKGQEFADDDTKKVFDMQGEKGGLCVQQNLADYVDSQKGEVNMMEYSRFMFEEDWVTRHTWLMDMPMEGTEHVKWDDVLNEVRKEYPQIDSQRDMWFRAQCIDNRLPGEPIDYEEMMEKLYGDDDDMDWDRMGMGAVEIEMSENAMSISMDGMSIEMEEGEDGNRMRIVLENATKVGASVAALAAMTLY